MHTACRLFAPHFAKRRCPLYGRHPIVIVLMFFHMHLHKCLILMTAYISERPGLLTGVNAAGLPLAACWDRHLSVPRAAKPWRHPCITMPLLRIYVYVYYQEITASHSRRNCNIPSLLRLSLIKTMADENCKTQLETDVIKWHLELLNLFCHPHTFCHVQFAVDMREI